MEAIQTPHYVKQILSSPITPYSPRKSTFFAHRILSRWLRARSRTFYRKLRFLSPKKQHLRFVLRRSSMTSYRRHCNVWHRWTKSVPLVYNLWTALSLTFTNKSWSCRDPMMSADSLFLTSAKSMSRDFDVRSESWYFQRSNNSSNRIFNFYVNMASKSLLSKY